MSSARIALVTVAVTVIVLVAATAAYFVGQSRRASDDAVVARVALAVEKRSNTADEEQRAGAEHASRSEP